MVISWSEIQSTVRVVISIAFILVRKQHFLEFMFLIVNEFVVN